MNTSAALVNNGDFCRTCLTVRSMRLNAEAISLLDDTMFRDINHYYKIRIGDHEIKTTWICEKCIRNVILWRERLKIAWNNQIVIDFLADKAASQCKKNPQP